jgi:hypothetical protein
LIRETISSNPNVVSKVRRDQWELLILKPLSKLKAGSIQQPLVLVIDALDECDGDNDVREILRLLSEAKTLETVRLRIFLTSRPETPIRLGFHKMPGILHQDLILHEIPRRAVDNDILNFFEYKFGAMRDDSESDDLPPDWPGKNYIDKLVTSAHGLFIYAATVCRFIEEGIQNFPAGNLLCLVLPDENMANSSSPARNINTNQSPTKELDIVYTQVLEHSLKNCPKEDKEQLAALSRQVLGTIVTLFDLLSLMAIARLLNMDDGVVKKRLNHLRSILDVPNSQDEHIRLLHPSFRDFLLSHKRCYNRQFWVDKRETHSMLLTRCLELLRQEGLRKDVCHLESPGTLRIEINSKTIDKYLLPGVRYACRYWICHLEQSGRQICDQDAVHIFLQEHFLHWLEALSLIGVMSESISLISTLQSLIAVSKYNVIFIRLLYQREPLER